MDSVNYKPLKMVEPTTLILNQLIFIPEQFTVKAHPALFEVVVVVVV